jgi:hypothetical protein
MEIGRFVATIIFPREAKDVEANSKENMKKVLKI